jgi:transcriptional regulator of heat shock response
MKVRHYQAGLAVVFLIVLGGTLHLMALNPAARDYLTPQEEERVKEAQVLDKRIEVFIKAAERRLLVLTDPSSKQVQKDLEKWGELPKGTRVELIMDIANILDAAITNIDDVAARDEKNPLLSKALRKLADAAARLQTQFTAMRDQFREVDERRAVEQVMENVQEILGAAKKL